MITAEEHILCLEPVSNDATLAMPTNRSQRLNRTFEAVKEVRLSILNDFKAFVVSVATSPACPHAWVTCRVINAYRKITPPRYRELQLSCQLLSESRRGLADGSG